MTIAVVQKTSVVGSLVSSVTTPSLSTTSGNLIHAAFVWYQSVANFTSFVDSVGNTYAPVASQNAGSAVVSTSAHVYAKNITGNAAHTWTLTLSANTYPSLSILEISGLDISAPLDQFNSSPSSGFPTSFAVSTGGPTTQADEIVISSLGGNEIASGPITITADAAYVDQNNIGDGVTTTPFDCQTRIISSTGYQTNTSTSSQGANFAAIISTYKAAAAAARFPRDSIVKLQAINRGML